MAKLYPRCIYGVCEEESFVRGLCREHYKKFHSSGELEKYGLAKYTHAPKSGGRGRKDLTNMRVGYLLVLESTDSRQTWRCACTICGQIITRKHHKLLGVINAGAKSYCGECFGPQQASKRRGMAVASPRAESAIENRNAAVMRTYREYRARALRRGIAWNLEVSDVESLIFQPCAYCGDPGDKVLRTVKYNGIDRIDNAVGYESANCAACCGACNRAKGTMPSERWKAYLQRMKVA